jgi:cold-inducible RNA-binding protein
MVILLASERVWNVPPEDPPAKADPNTTTSDSAGEAHARGLRWGYHNIGQATALGPIVINIYVGNLPFTTTDTELEDLFSQFGQINRAAVITDRETGRSRGFGFVEMENDEEGKKAIEEMNESDFNGRQLTVNEARPRAPRTGGGGGGGGGYGGGGGGYSNHNG